MLGSNYNAQIKNKDISPNNLKNTVSFGQKGNPNEKVDFAEYLGKDFGGLTGGNIIQEDNEAKMESLKNEAKNLNSALTYFGFPKLGDLFNDNLFEIENTLRW